MNDPLTPQLQQRLAELLRGLRRDWDMPGIQSALVQAATIAPALDVCRAAIACAANEQARTPGMIPRAGHHWEKTAAAALAVPKECADHPGEHQIRCTKCPAEIAAAMEHLPENVAKMRAAIGRPDAVPREHRNPVADARLNPEELEAARARLDREDQP